MAAIAHLLAVCVLPLTLGAAGREHSGQKARTGTRKRCCDHRTGTVGLRCRVPSVQGQRCWLYSYTPSLLASLAPCLDAPGTMGNTCECGGVRVHVGGVTSLRRRHKEREGGRFSRQRWRPHGIGPLPALRSLHTLLTHPPYTPLHTFGLMRNANSAPAYSWPMTRVPRSYGCAARGPTRWLPMRADIIVRLTASSGRANCVCRYAPPWAHSLAGFACGA